MRRFSVLLLLAVAGTARAVAPDDEAHRADRNRTEQLNREAARAVARRDAGAKARADQAYAAARARYQRELAAWRRQVEACRDGDYSACDER